ncbi:hypothetical protein ACQCVK_14275 [Rossellomorea vietnamensis]|uniref:PepSY domain-containing protein n=1 Tax=Rossellomorea aquimaris TaxID=189382 RepID=A0A5D4TXI3_9BACI|nr:hypothetical protein [Rossellomorea aquimaris]TYS79711.1 hypothetical protein FZC80_08685 [Rossellomorea aquimaris]
MKQFLISMAIIFSVGTVLMLNGVTDNVQEVNSSFENELSEEAAAQTPAEPLLLPAELKNFIEEENKPDTAQTELIPANLEYLFDAKFEEDGYIVEIYREYEIYRDADGNVIKEVPTSNFEYMRYKE